jgi:predicted O-methyltransferase YrrM
MAKPASTREPWHEHLKGGLLARWQRLQQILFRARFGSRTPVMGTFDDQRCQLEEELQPAYQRYVEEVSDPVAAVSLELSCVLLHLCRLLHPGTILDLGSGFSSYLFRRYQQESNGSCTVYSCDDNPYWLDKTDAYLRSHQLSTEHLYEWDSFVERFPELGADLILFDLSSPARRVKVMPALTRYLTSSTLLCVDDVHKPPVRAATEQLIRSARLRYADLTPWSLDQYGRFSWLLLDPDLP